MKKPLKPKNSYNKKEIEELFKSYNYEIKRFGILSIPQYDHLQNWIKIHLNKI